MPLFSRRKEHVYICVCVCLVLFPRSYSSFLSCIYSGVWDSGTKFWLCHAFEWCITTTLRWILARAVLWIQSPLYNSFKLWWRACGLSCWWMRLNALTGWQEFIWSFSLYLRDCGHCVRSVCWSWWSWLMQPDCALWVGTTLPLDYMIWKKHIRNTKGKGRLC
jgi:hypothetical protein